MLLAAPRRRWCSLDTRQRAQVRYCAPWYLPWSLPDPEMCATVNAVSLNYVRCKRRAPNRNTSKANRIRQNLRYLRFLRSPPDSAHSSPPEWTCIKLQVRLSSAASLLGSRESMCSTPLDAPHKGRTHCSVPSPCSAGKITSRFPVGPLTPPQPIPPCCSPSSLVLPLFFLFSSTFVSLLYIFWSFLF